jgi:hypothetical protein
MNLPKQSRPVIRDVTRDPIRIRVEGAQSWTPGLNPYRYDPEEIVARQAALNACLEKCRERSTPYTAYLCEENCRLAYRLNQPMPI